MKGKCAFSLSKLLNYNVPSLELPSVKFKSIPKLYNLHECVSYKCVIYQRRKCKTTTQKHRRRDRDLFNVTVTHNSLSFSQC